MSIYGTWLSIEDERQVAASLESHGINHGVVDDDGEVEDLNDLPPEMLDAPIVYEGSHVLPSDSDRRGGAVEVAAIPNHIERHDRPELPDGTLKDWLRLSVHSLDSNCISESRDGKPPYVKGGDSTVVLTRPQVERLRETLTAWLERPAGEPDSELDAIAPTQQAVQEPAERTGEEGK